MSDQSGSHTCYDPVSALEDWKYAKKSRSVNVSIGNGYGATCWTVELVDGEHKVVCSETDFVGYDGIDPLWHEHAGNLYCVVENGDDMDEWPGLAATIRRAIECADKFFGP